MTSADEPMAHKHKFMPTPNPKWLDLQSCSCGAIRSGKSTFVPNADGTALILEAPHPDAARPAGEVLTEIRVTDEAMAVLHGWVSSGDITISQAIIDHAAPTPAGEQTICGHPECFGQTECILATPPTGTPIDKIFYDELRGKTVTEGQAYILKWAEARLKPAISAAYDARFEAALGPDNYEAEVDSAEADYVDADEAHIGNSLKATARARWYASSGGNDGK